MLAQFKESLERRRQELQTEIDSRKTAVERNRLGQFATPNSLALKIARYVAGLVENNDAIQFADPAIGSGSFFSAALNVFGRSRIVSAIGVELDSAFCDVARELWGTAGLEIIHGDFTRIVGSGLRPSSPNLVLANPPYVRHHHLDRIDKERLQALAFQTAGVQVSGLAGLYVYFLLLATAWMEDDGVAAWLIPSEFMDVNYGAALKRFLCDRVTLVRIHRFDPNDVQFGDALVSSVVVVFKKSHPPARHSVEFTFGGRFDEPIVTDSIPAEELRDARKWTIYPSHDNNDRLATSKNDGPTLADVFLIQRGIATGCNKFFILNRDAALSRRLPERFLRPILPSPRHLKATIVDADGEGYPLLDNPLCLIDCDLREHLVEDKYPALWNYLQTAESLGILDGYLVSRRTPWYKQERRDPAPFLCTYMGRGSHEKRPFRFIWNRSAAIGTNLYLMLYPRNSLKEMLQRHPIRAGEVHKLLSELNGHELRGEGRVYGGGLHKIEPRELGRMSAKELIHRWPELSKAVVRDRTSRLFD